MDQTSIQQSENFVHMLVHEMRNPLTNISLANGCIRDIANGSYNDGVPMQTFTEMIAKNVNKLEQLLRKTLATKDENAVALSDTDVCSCIEEALQHAEDRMYLQKVDINKHYNACPVIKADGERLTIAFLNIIINALEAMENKEGAQLDITVYIAGGQIKVAFKDNGKGMEDGIAKKIFDPHYTSKDHGLGMGLANTKKILDGHLASISVNSLAGIGTSVVIGFS